LLDYCFHDFTPLRHIIIAAIDLFRRDVSLHFHSHFHIGFFDIDDFIAASFRQPLCRHYFQPLAFRYFQLIFGFQTLMEMLAALS
jgi:hypothetical protein